MSEARVVIVAIHARYRATEALVERLASRRGYIVTNPRRLDERASVTFGDGSPMHLLPGTELWIADVVIADTDQESA